MKNMMVTSIGVLLLICILPTSLWAWCWVRDTGTTDSGCTDSKVQQSCCDGILRKWIDSRMEYHISTFTDNSLEDYIVDGMGRWNNVDRSEFVFNRGLPDTTEFLFKQDNVNVINIDSQFCDTTHYGENSLNGDLCEQGILGFSGTFTPAPGSSEPFQAKESDIILNGAEFVWADGDPIGNTSTIDTEAVVAHEGGHSAGLSHAGATCRSAGSSGCGAEFPSATMYYAMDVGSDTNKASLELDDAAALIYGYPKSSFRVEVLNSPNGDPIIGAEVDLLDSAAPVNGTSIAQGGRVFGDITATTALFGDGASSSTYASMSPFEDTDQSGRTNFINPVTETFRVSVAVGGLGPVTASHSVVTGESTLTVNVTTDETDFAGPDIQVTSHSNGEAVGDPAITLAGTASDVQRGSSGVAEVTVDGVTASGTTSWSRDITLSEGSNAIDVVATDGSAQSNTNTETITIVYDITPPEVSLLTPADGATNVDAGINIVAQFNEAMDATSFTTATFSVDNGVTGSVSYNSGTHSASLTPLVDLSYDTTYTVTLTTGIKDAVGNALAGDIAWSFTTRSAPGSSDGSSGCFIDAAAMP